ncbi:MAG: hypothetical protein R3213_09365, partial [Flavobacteriaceae bacterium]|nr:hypothetical protein [Flavobacteriaceae bacterium]
RSTDMIIEMYDRSVQELQDKDYTIAGLRKEVEELQLNIKNLNDELNQRNKNNSSIVFTSLAKDVKVRFSELQYFSLAERLESSDFIKVDTVMVVNLRWPSNMQDSIKTQKETNLVKYLTTTLSKENIKIERVSN